MSSRRSRVGSAVGQWAGRPAHCHYRTPRDGFPITGLLSVWALSLVPLTVYLIVTVGVKEAQVCVPVILPVPIPVMYLYHVLCREV